MLTGRWYYEIITQKTAYNPYAGMQLRYEAILCLEGNRIHGTAEKIFESSAAQPHRHYIGDERKRASVQGYIQKNYFGKDKMFLHIVEQGSRESTTYQELEDATILHGLEWRGQFQSMVASQEGVCHWARVNNEKECC